jgi:hypothetical protein
MAEYRGDTGTVKEKGEQAEDIVQYGKILFFT